MNKFENIPQDKDTEILYSSPMKWGDIDIVYQRWVFDNILGESIIFFNSDNAETSEELKKQVRESAIFNNKSEITIKKGDVYTFVNFNFRKLQ